MQTVKLKMVENFVRKVLSQDLNQKHVGKTRVRAVALKVCKVIPDTNGSKTKQRRRI